MYTSFTLKTSFKNKTSDILLKGMSNFNFFSEKT